MAVGMLTRFFSKSVGRHRMLFSTASGRLINLHSAATSMIETVFNPPAVPVESLTAAALHCSRIVAGQHDRHLPTRLATTLTTCKLSQSVAAASVCIHPSTFDVIGALPLATKMICPAGVRVPVPLNRPHAGRLVDVDGPSDGRPITIEKKAARLIKIRRRKMKKHKLRKLRKRMYHVFAKIRHRREVAKEKVFQDELLAQMNRADEFDARAWVDEFLRKATTDPQTLLPKKPKRVRPTQYVIR